MAFYLCAIMVNSVLWKLLPFLQSSLTMFILIGVLVIEGIRPIYYRFYTKFHNSFESISTNKVVFPMNDLFGAISSGFGWGIVHILLFYSPIISKSIGPGTYFQFNQCSTFSVITKAVYLTPPIFIQHISLMIIFFNGFYKKSTLQWWIAMILHLFASLWSEFEECTLLIVGEYIIAFIEIIWSFYLIHKPDYRRKLKGL
ncbi:hypothetical protein RFI_16181 [Reticulomyxa filosa]|nr:hypothetical protein RFI_16181 [Reticulomyxa filosa]|eukprot:ETO21023.1 hypothetical protein RFI_16181 [Reticulomyxa filosa]